MIYVPGYGTFDPTFPTWLELRPDGKLYNKNALDLTKAWVIPEGFVGNPPIYTFTREVLPPPPPPIPIWPLDKPLRDFYAAGKALVANERARFAKAHIEAQQNLDDLDALIQLTDDFYAKLDAVLTQLAALAVHK